MPRSCSTLGSGLAVIISRSSKHVDCRLRALQRASTHVTQIDTGSATRSIIRLGLAYRSIGVRGDTTRRFPPAMMSLRRLRRNSFRACLGILFLRVEIDRWLSRLGFTSDLDVTFPFSFLLIPCILRKAQRKGRGEVGGLQCCASSSSSCIMLAEILPLFFFFLGQGGSTGPLHARRNHRDTHSSLLDASTQLPDFDSRYNCLMALILSGAAYGVSLGWTTASVAHSLCLRFAPQAFSFRAFSDERIYGGRGGGGWSGATAADTFGR